MAQARIGHFLEAQVPQSLGVDYIDESEVLTPARELQAPQELVKEVAAAGKLPVVLFTVGGIATTADAAVIGAW